MSSHYQDQKRASKYLSGLSYIGYKKRRIKCKKSFKMYLPLPKMHLKCAFTHLAHMLNIYCEMHLGWVGRKGYTLWLKHQHGS